MQVDFRFDKMATEASIALTNRSLRNVRTVRTTSSHRVTSSNPSSGTRIPHRHRSNFESAAVLHPRPASRSDSSASSSACPCRLGDKHTCRTTLRSLPERPILSHTISRTATAASICSDSSRFGDSKRPVCISTNRHRRLGTPAQRQGASIGTHEQ